MCITYFYLDAQRKEKRIELKQEWSSVRGVESKNLQNWKCKAVNEKVLRNPTYTTITHLFIL